MTRTEKKLVRDYIINMGVEKVRILSDGTVSAYGKMPCTNDDGWFFAGWDDQILRLVKARAA